MTTQLNTVPKIGRPYSKTKKQGIYVKLPPHIVEWLRDQDKSQAVLIEEALRKHYSLDSQ